MSEMAQAFKYAEQNRQQSSQYNKRRLNKTANVGPTLTVGTKVLVKADTRLTNTAHWDPIFEVIKTRGTTHWLRHIENGKLLKLHRNKLQIVNTDTDWDAIRKRPIRL